MKRIQMITGHYGSGKTEYAVNLALRLAAEGKKTVLADLDIVNPYFRSYEQTKRLEAAGIRVIVTSCGGVADIRDRIQFRIGSGVSGAKSMSNGRSRTMSRPSSSFTPITG